MRFQLRRRLGICVALLGAGLLSGTARAEGPRAELSTPKLAALSFVRAMEADDMNAFRSVTIGNDEDYTLYEPLLGMVGAAKRMEKAARQRFGKAGRLVSRNSPAVELEVHVQESDVAVTADRATLRHKGDGDADPLTLARRAGEWKVDLTAIRNRQAMADQAPALRKMRDVLAGCADDIAVGKFKSAEEAEQALLGRLRTVTSEKPAK